MSVRHCERRVYSTDFKIEVLKEMVKQGLSYGATARKFGILSQVTVSKWEKSFQLDAESLPLPQETSDSAMRQKKTKESALQSGTSSEMSAAACRIAELEDQVQRLRSALAYSELRTRGWMKLVEISSKELGIDLLKKAGAKQ